MAEAGIDLKTLQYISRHSNVTTTMGIYAHTRLGLVQEAGDKVGELLRQ
jgi:integrase